MIVEVGLAETFAPVVALNAVEGLHAYVFAPPAVSAADCPLQIVCEGVTETTGSGLTVTVTCADDVHPFTSPVTVYVVVEDGFAVTLAPVVALSAVGGLHEYVLAPLAVSVADCPMQIIGADERDNTGKGFTVTVTCAVEVQPMISPVTV